MLPAEEIQGHHVWPRDGRGGIPGRADLLQRKGEAGAGEAEGRAALEPAGVAVDDEDG